MQSEDSLFNYLLQTVSGEKFEILSKKIYSEIEGYEFVPLGGIHDGGADGFYLPHVFSSHAPKVFYQISVTDGNLAKKKIKDTIAALKKNDRDVLHLFYITSEKIPKQDILQQEIFREHSILLTIKDGEMLHSIVSSRKGIHKLFYDTFSIEINDINKYGPKTRAPINEFVVDPTIFAQLEYELQNLDDNDHLDEAVVDALIYWSLRNTSNDDQIYLTRDQIKFSISEVVVTDRKFLYAKIDGRLNALSKKTVSEESRIRIMNPNERFCISFQMRTKVAQKSIEDDASRAAFLTSIKMRIAEISPNKLGSEKNDALTEIVNASIHDFFVEQGLLLSAFLEKKVEHISGNDQIVERQVKRALTEKGRKLNISPDDVGQIMLTLRSIFYHQNAEEQAYLSRVSKTALLMTTLRSAPRMLEYFNKMSGRFKLLVGTDILVKAMSEDFLRPEDRHVDKLLRACSELGCELTLTECVLNEIFTHLHAVDLEYRNHYLEQEKYTKDFNAIDSDKILIRSFFYNKSNSGNSWDQFINSFLSPKNLRSKSEAGKDELKGLLVQRYSMEFIGSKEMQPIVDQDQVDAVASQLDAARPDRNVELSKNDALMAHLVYALRALRKETATYDGFGYNTWWLTKETLIIRHTHDLIKKHGDSQYIIRPEFILNFIVLAPKAAKVRKAYGEMLPTNVGLQLGEYLRPERMRQLLSLTSEWSKMTPERVSVMIEQRINRLKTSRYKRYLNEIGDHTAGS